MNKNLLTLTCAALLLTACPEMPIDENDAGDSGSMMNVDAGLDAGKVDAGKMDAGKTDAGDGGGTDAGDSGVDSGFDAGFDAGAPKEWVGIIGNGQSLSVGVSFGYAPPISVTQPFGAKKLVDLTSMYALSGAGTWQMVPLVEPYRVKTCTLCYEYPNNVVGESPHTGMAIQLSALSLARDAGDFMSVHSITGTSGAALASINKTGLPDGGVRPPYLAGLMETRVYKNLAADAGAKYRVGGVIFTHGESDWNNPNYASELHTLWSDYNTDLKAITGQTQNIPIFLSQQNSFPGAVDAGFTLSPNDQWKVAVTYPGEFVCVGPKYAYSYSDTVHLSSSGYHRLGEKYGQAFDRVVNQGLPFKPLYPIATSLSGNKITVTFHVPVPPMAWDDHIALSHQNNHKAWKDGHGFEAEDSTGQLTITSATIVGNTVELILNNAPTGTGLTVRHAQTPDGYPTADGGFAFSGAYFANTSGGHVGYLRDSDPFRGAWSQTIRVNATAGSTTYAVLDAGGSTERWNKYDMLESPHLPSDARMVSRTADGGSFVANRPWDAGSGPANIVVRHDHRNWAVQFFLPVPYTE